jgi:hypothetical protein
MRVNITFLLGFWYGYAILIQVFLKMLWSPMYFLGYLERGIDVWSNESIAFLLGFERAIQYPSKYMIWSPNYFMGT